MKLRLPLPALLLVAFILQAPSAAASSEGWLPLKRSAVIRLLAAETNIEVLRVDTWKELQRILTVNSKSAPNKIYYLVGTAAELSQIVLPSESLAQEEAITIAGNPAIPLTIVMAGKDEYVHSVRVRAAVVNYSASESERVFNVLAALFRSVFPAWAEAGEWPITSLREAWDAHPLAAKRSLKDPNDMIIRRQFDGITSATFGVPPDFVVYAITARNQCVPRFDESNPLRRVSPLQRIIC